MVPYHWLVSGLSEIELVTGTVYHMFRQLSTNPLVRWLDALPAKAAMITWDIWVRANVDNQALPRSVGQDLDVDLVCACLRTLDLARKLCIPELCVPTWSSISPTIWPTSYRLKLCFWLPMVLETSQQIALEPASSSQASCSKVPQSAQPIMSPPDMSYCTPWKQAVIATQQAAANYP